MVEKDLVYNLKIKHTGNWNFKDSYKYTSDFLRELGYFIVEKTYNEKVSGSGKEIEIEWLCFRKISDYFRYQIQIRWLVTNLTDVEVSQNGNKIKTNKGGFEMAIKAFLEKDYEHKWEAKPFNKFIRGVYDRYIIRPRIQSYEDRMIEEVDEFATQVKSFLMLEGK